MTDKKFDDLETRDLEIERNGQVKKFRVYELRADEARKILNTTKPNGKKDPEKAKAVDARLCAAAVKEVRDDGSTRDITFDEASSMGTSLRMKLVKAAMDINGFLDDDEKN
jgi:hypothetical protein